jgi:hypothetical protein
MTNTRACPPREVLIDAAGPESTDAAREALADHLIACGACADEFRLLRALAPWASERAAVFGGGRVPAKLAAASAWAYAVAAMFAAIAVLLGIEVMRLSRANAALGVSASARAPADNRLADDTGKEARLADQQKTIRTLEQRLRAAETPDVNLPIVDLEPADALRSAAPAEPVTIPAGARNVVFVLNTANVRARATFEVDIVGADDQVAWTGPGLKESAAGTLTLMVPWPMVERAARVRLYSRSADRRALVEEYVLPRRR